MSCCNYPTPFKCESPEHRVDKDLLHVKSEYGIDLEKYRDSFIHHAGQYVIEWFPRLIGSQKHTLYNMAIYLSSHPYYNAFVINTKRKTLRMIPREKHKRYVDQWLIEAEVELKEREKDEWREKLRSVGVDVQW